MISESWNRKRYKFLLLVLVHNLLAAFVSSATYFNQSAGYNIDVDLNTWSNFDANMGCVTCPYTCVKPKIGPNGININTSDTTQMESLPAIYSAVERNGCCFAKKSLAITQPTCDAPANPPEAEDCGFLSGPALNYSITAVMREVKKPLMAILFASIDCENFWAVGFTYVKVTKTGKAIGSKVINKGCYGAPSGSPIVLAGCITNQLKFDKSAKYPWQLLAQKCRGLGGRCSRTNSIWGLNLKCCSDMTNLKAKWNLRYSLYLKDPNRSPPLSGLAITAIVFASVALMMALVHFGSKLRQRSKYTAMKREQEAADDYDEIITPLQANRQVIAHPNRSTLHVPASITVSLHENDKIYRPPQDEVLLEGDLY